MPLAAVFQLYVLPALIRYAIAWAVKHDKINLLEGELIKFGMSLKADHDLKDFPDAPPEETNVHNFTVGKKQEP